MDRILISLKKENGPRASSAPALGLNTIIFKHVYWYMQQTQVSVYRTIGALVRYFINIFVLLKQFLSIYSNNEDFYFRYFIVAHVHQENMSMKTIPP